MINWQSVVVAPLIKVYGQPAIYTQGGTSYTINGVFDEAYRAVDPATGMPVDTLTPCFGFNLADLPVIPTQKDRLNVLASGLPGVAPVADTLYVVRNPQPDGHGWCRVLLNLAPTTTPGAAQDA